MSITISHQMFSCLSQATKDELLSTFKMPQGAPLPLKEMPLQCPKELEDELDENYVPKVVEKPVTTVLGSPFYSASLSFTSPIVLPNMIKEKKTYSAQRVPIAHPRDLYTVKSDAEIKDIMRDINLGYFVGPSSWQKGEKHHPENFDVCRVINVLKNYGPVNSYTINTKLLTMPSPRITSILRHLKMQGIVRVRTNV